MRHVPPKTLNKGKGLRRMRLPFVSVTGSGALLGPRRRPRRSAELLRHYSSLRSFSRNSGLEFIIVLSLVLFVHLFFLKTYDVVARIILFDTPEDPK